MTQEQLQDALGMIDDDLIESVDKLRQQRDSHAVSDQPASLQVFSSFRKGILRREILKWGSLAASLCLLVGVGFLWTLGGNKATSLADKAENLFSKQEDAEDIHIEAVQEANPESASPTKPETSPQENFSDTPNIIYPSLTLSNEEESIDAAFYQVYWCFTNMDGNAMWVTTESIHPLDREDRLIRLKTSLPTLQLQFHSAPDQPDNITVHYWHESNWGDHTTVSQLLPLENGQIPLLEGGYIYEVTAQWGSDQGTMSYCFYAYYTPAKP